MQLLDDAIMDLYNKGRISPLTMPTPNPTTRDASGRCSNRRQRISPKPNVAAYLTPMDEQ
jgi:hypothetical protein